MPTALPRPPRMPVQTSVLAVTALLGSALGLSGIGLDEQATTRAQSAWIPAFGDPSIAELTVVGTEDDGLDNPRDLAFHPDRPDELWTVNRNDDSTVMFEAAGTEAQDVDKRIDRYANHFMEEVSSIAFGDFENFATCQESRNTYNNRREGNDFMGPTLWDSDLEVYGRANQGGQLSDRQIDALMQGGLCRGTSPTDADGTNQGGTLGSHIDMNHQSPDCMGIEHQAGNAYWVTDGHNGHVVYYDFVKDHGPGGDDHSDAVVRRYPEASFTRVEGVPGHMVLDEETNWLYYADTGAGVVRRIDVTSGAEAREIRRANEPLAEFTEYEDADVEVFAEGFVEPAGLALREGILFVSDHASGDIVALDIEDGEALDRLATGAEGIMGLAFDPEGRLWYVNGDANQLVRVDPRIVTPTPSATDTPSSTPTATSTPTPERFWGFLPRLEQSTR